MTFPPWGVSVNDERRSALTMKTAIFATLLLIAGLVHAHSGGTNSQSCHTDHKTGNYHCH